MRKSRTPGSVRGVSGNGYPYRDKCMCAADQYWQWLSMISADVTH